MPAKEVMPKEVDGIVVALCADYFRRKKLIENRDAGYSVIMECRFLNYRILDAARQVAGDVEAEIYIRDIGGRTGYTKSKLNRLSEGNYKEKKAAVKIAIAKRLLLM